MKRRSFIEAVIAAPWVWLAACVAPRRWREAVRSRHYPGPVAPLDPAEIRRRGRWAG
ncbi:MAG: hypothetical protein GWP08_00265 [Nitrospiraceae bacterium]|nr:hypothetical protein [Nitrospiraceae bacterium]